LALAVECRVQVGKVPVLDFVPETNQELKVLALGRVFVSEVLLEAFS